MLDQTSDPKYPSKERVERDGVLIHAEGDDLINDPEEAERQGYEIAEVISHVATERIEHDSVLIAAEGDTLSADQLAKAGDKAAPAKAKSPKAAKVASKK